MVILTSVSFTQLLYELIEKHDYPILFHYYYHDPTTPTYSLYLHLPDFSQIVISADSLEDCLKKLDEELTYWKQHGVNPNV